MLNMKEKFKISPLKSIDIILKELDFLQYCTQKRNLSYELQYLNFLKELNDNYEIDKGLRSIFIRNIIICINNIIEYLLIISLSQIYNKSVKAIKSDRVKSLIDQAKRNNIITKEFSKRLKFVNEKRNKIHPLKQIELDVKYFNESDLQECIDVLDLLIAKLSEFFNSKNIEVEEEYQDKFEDCMYCATGGPFENDSICPACHRIIIN